MDLFVPFSLALDVLPDRFLIPMSADGVHVEPTSPEVASPEHFLDFGVQTEHLFGGDALCCSDDLRGSHHGHGLDEKMDVILVRSDLDVVQFVVLLNFVADIFQGLFVLFREDLPAIFGRAYQVVEKKSDVVTFTNVLAAHTESLPCFRHSIAL